MNFKRITEARLKRFAIMGWFMILFAAVCSFSAYFSPSNESNYWLSREGKEGFYVLSLLFVFLGCYCLGAIWRERRYF